MSGMAAQAMARSAPVAQPAGIAYVNSAIGSEVGESSPAPAENELRSEECKPRHRERQLEMQLAQPEHAAPTNLAPAILECSWPDHAWHATAGVGAMSRQRQDAAADHRRTPRLQLRLQLGQAP